jgi:hypothetical protein
LRFLGRHYRYLSGRWWYLVDESWRQQGGRERLRSAVRGLWQDMAPEDVVPDYLVDRLVWRLAVHLFTDGLPGRPEHTEATERHLGAADPG